VYVVLLKENKTSKDNLAIRITSTTSKTNMVIDTEFAPTERQTDHKIDGKFPSIRFVFPYWWRGFPALAKIAEAVSGNSFCTFVAAHAELNDS
jgi:hypothetical protein